VSTRPEMRTPSPPAWEYGSGPSKQPTMKRVRLGSREMLGAIILRAAGLSGDDVGAHRMPKESRLSPLYTAAGATFAATPRPSFSGGVDCRAPRHFDGDSPTAIAKPD